MAFIVSSSGSACSGRAAAMKLGRRAVARVAQQRELGDQQDRPAHIGDGAVHFALGVLEHAQPRQLFRAQARVGFGIAHFGPDQRRIAPADAADHFVFHGHAGARDPLNHHAHNAITSPPGTLR